jgi:hypothetical protein
VVLESRDGRSLIKASGFRYPHDAYEACITLELRENNKKIRSICMKAIGFIQIFDTLPIVETFKHEYFKLVTSVRGHFGKDEEQGGLDEDDEVIWEKLIKAAGKK